MSLNFRYNTEADFNDATGAGLLNFGMKSFQNDKTFAFSVNSFGGTSIASFLATKLNSRNIISKVDILDSNLITFANNVFYCAKNQAYLLDSDSIYRFQLIDNAGNVYNSESFQTFSEITSLEIQNTTGNGSLASQTSELFENVNGKLYFGLKQFLANVCPSFSIKTVQNDVSIVSFEALKINSKGAIVSTTELTTDYILIESGLIKNYLFEYDLSHSSIYCFRIVTDTAVYYTEYFNTIKTTNLNGIVSFDLTIADLYGTLTTFDGTSDDYFDFSQQ